MHTILPSDLRSASSIQAPTIQLGLGFHYALRVHRHEHPSGSRSFYVVARLLMLACSCMESQGNEEHFACMDVLPIHWATGNSGALSILDQRQSVCGILLEVWRSGGLLHVDEPIASGTVISLLVGGEEIKAEVEGYETDEFGCYLRLKVNEPWFPLRYQPPELVW